MIELIFSLKRMRAFLCLEINTCLKFHAVFELVNFYNVHFDFSQIPKWHLYFEEGNSSSLTYS